MKRSSSTSLAVRQMVAVIDARFAECSSLREVALVIGRREAYLGRIFRRRIGMSVREYLAERRMERALRSILKGEKVEAIALEVGYKSKKTFYRHFRQRFGTTPTVYRGLTNESGAMATAAQPDATEESEWRRARRG